MKRYLVVVLMLCSLSVSSLAQTTKSGSDYGQLTYTTIDVPGHSTILSGINNNGVIAGQYDYSGGDYRSFTWENGAFNYFSLPAGYTVAYGINDAGLVVGYYITTGTDRAGFLYDGQTFTTVQYPGVPITEATGINNAGLIVGIEAPDAAPYTGFLFNGTQFRTFVVPGPDTRSTWPGGVNNFGDVSGTVDSGGAYEGFLRTRAGKYQTFAYPGAIFTSAAGINDNRIIVGTYLGNALQSCFYMKGGRFKSIAVPHAMETICLGINNAGVIVGYYQDSRYTLHGFMTSPVTDADLQ